MTEPTKKDLDDTVFEAIWQAIKDWDIQRTQGGGYAGATGTDVMTILGVVRTFISEATRSENRRCQEVLARVFEELGEQGVTLEQLQQAVTIAQLPDAMESDTSLPCKSSPHCSHNTNGRDLSLPCSIELK